MSDAVPIFPLRPEADICSRREIMTTDPHYLSPHCQTGNCAWCTERRLRAHLLTHPPLVSKPGDHWDNKLGMVQANGRAFGYWPLDIPPSRTDTKITWLKPPHPGGPKHRKVWSTKCK